MSLSTRYPSRWDASTWFIIGLVTACCVVIFFFDDFLVPAIISFLVLLSVTIMLISIYYKIEGENLLVYTLFRPKSYPISKIKEIRSTTNTLSAPATSLTHRLQIIFSDPALNSHSNPLIISPVNSNLFIAQLIEINPEIITSNFNTPKTKRRDR